MVNAEAAAVRVKWYEDRGREVPPDALPPEVWPGAEYWLDLFWELSTDRQIGMGCGPIPAASIDRVTRDWPDDDATAFRTCIRSMDRAFLQIVNDQKPAETTETAADQFRDATSRKRRVGIIE